MKVFEISQVKSINWDELDISPLAGEMAEDLTSFINRALKNSTHGWWSEHGFQKCNKQNYLTIKSNAERMVLPMANTARAIATALKFNIFDGEIARVTYQKAQDYAVKLLRTLSYNYIANMANGWRALSVTAECAVVGMLMWDKLNKTDKMLFINMLDYGASELLDVKAEFLSDASQVKKANIITNDANRAKVLTIAALMMPTHERAAKWQAKAKFFLKASVSTPKDGMKGYNIMDDGLARGGANIDVEEMLAVANALDTALPTLLFGKDVSSVIALNTPQVYHAFNDLYLSRARRQWEPMYMRRIDGELIPELNIASKSKLDKGQLMQTYLLDCYAYCFDLDNGCEITAREWAEARMNSMQIRQKAHASYKFFAAARGKNWAKEAKLVAEASMAYAMLYCKAAGLIKTAKVSEKELV